MKLVQEHLLTTNHHNDIKEVSSLSQPQDSASSSFASLRRKHLNFIPTISAPLENPELAIASVSYIKLAPISTESYNMSQTDPQLELANGNTRSHNLPENFQNLRKNSHNADHNETPTTYSSVTDSPTVTSLTSPDSLNSHTLTSLNRYNLTGTFTDI